MKKELLNVLLVGILLLGITGCGNKINDDTNKNNIDEALLGVWSGESTRNQMCTWTFEEEKVSSECVYGFNSTDQFTGIYEIKEDNIIIITSDETGKKIEYEYEIKNGKRLWLIATDGSTSYEDFDLEEKFEKK